MAEKAVYDNVQSGKDTQTRGKNLYLLFDKVITLNQIMRQRDPAQAQFREILRKVAEGGFTIDDWNVLETRNFHKLSKEEQALFEQNSLYMCARNKDLIPFNVMRYEALKVPIAVIHANNNPPSLAKAASTDVAGGLLNSIILAEGCQVILKNKIWQQAGLVNGSRGFVRHILYKPNSGPPALPDCVLVHFPDYKGPSVEPFSDEEKIVPVFPQTASWFNKNTPCARTQIPLIPGYAASIHVTQGQTLGEQTSYQNKIIDVS